MRRRRRGYDCFLPTCAPLRLLSENQRDCRPGKKRSMGPLTLLQSAKTLCSIYGYFDPPIHCNARRCKLVPKADRTATWHSGMRMPAAVSDRGPPRAPGLAQATVTESRRVSYGREAGSLRPPRPPLPSTMRASILLFAALALAAQAAPAGHQLASSFLDTAGTPSPVPSLQPLPSKEPLRPPIAAVVDASPAPSLEAVAETAVPATVAPSPEAVAETTAPSASTAASPSATASAAVAVASAVPAHAAAAVPPAAGTGAAPAPASATATTGALGGFSMLAVIAVLAAILVPAIAIYGRARRRRGAGFRDMPETAPQSSVYAPSGTAV